MIELAITVCKHIFDIVISKKSNDSTKISKISENLNQIASVLQDTADKFKLDQYPHSNCIILEKLSSDLYKFISPYVEDEEIMILKSTLDEAFLVEKLFANRNQDLIQSLEKASGEFRYIAIKINF